jgi:choline dehydrogenase-like flavoprotein
VVVGGGPSGATAAADLARQGFSVMLLDRAGRIKPCGGAIPPALINEFEIVQSSYKYSNFVDDMELAFQFIPEAGAKTALCGMGAMSYWSKMEATNGIAGKSGWQVKLSESRPDTLGFNYRVLETPHGIINLVPTPGFKGARKNQMLIVSEENLQHVQYRAPRFRANIKTDNAPDLVKDEYFSDEGVGYTLIESHKLFNIR